MLDWVRKAMISAGRVQGGYPVGERVWPGSHVAVYVHDSVSAGVHRVDLVQHQVRGANLDVRGARVERQVTSDLHALLVCDLVEALRTCSTLPELRAAVAAACEERAPDTQPESAPSWDVDSELGKEFGG